MSFEVLQPGTFSMLVDLGRPRTRHLGIPLGGAADRAAYQIGNALIGNPLDAPALEITLSGPTLRAEHQVVACVFGAPFDVQVDGEPIQPASIFPIRAGQIVRIGGTSRGSRTYLCVAGGFRAKSILESRSSLMPLAVGDHLECAESFGPGRSLPHADAESLLDQSFDPNLLHVMDGPQADWFAANEFLDRTYTVSAASNRMGVRLLGEAIQLSPRELASEAVAPGAIQITNDGLPIILGIDGQTIGGYPKIAHVIRADLDRLAQLRPNQSVRFRRVTLDEAEHLAEERRCRMHLWFTRLRLAAL